MKSGSSLLASGKSRDARHSQERSNLLRDLEKRTKPLDQYRDRLGYGPIAESITEELS
jgi:hypothetical protein